jgi:putative ABC transport system ATP-binding protein
VKQVTMATEPVMIDAQVLVHDYPVGETAIHALRGVSFSVRAGELVAVMGPSGSGKSTLMHLIGCLDTPTSGTVRIAGEDVSNLSETELAVVRNRRIGFVFQRFNLIPRISILDNVTTPLLYAGVSPRLREERAAEALEKVGLGTRLLHRSVQLSGGQQQRVAIARALVTNPIIILADEPTGNLDTATGKAILELFKAVNAAGTTVIIVTHDAEVSSVCRRVLHLRDGLIEHDRGISNAG